MEFFSLILSLVAIFLAVSANNRSKRILDIINKNFLEKEKSVASKESLAHADKEGIARQSAPFKWQAKEQTDFAQFKTQNDHRFENKFITWLKTNTLMKIGSAFVLGAFLWFVSLAYSYGWIGPYTIIFASLLISGVVAFFGFYDALKLDSKRGLVLLGVGNAMALATVFSAQNLYNMFAVEFAFLLIFIFTAFVTFASVRFSSLALSVFSYIFASLIPFIVGDDAGNFYSFLTYLLILNLIYSGIAFYKNWHSLQILNFISFIIYSFIAFFIYKIQFEETLFAYLFPLVFFAGATYALRKFDDKNTKSIYLGLSLAYTFAIATWTYAGLYDSAKDLIAPIFIAWSFAFLLLSFAFSLIYKKNAPFLLFGADALFLLSWAITLLVPASALPSIFTVEAILATIFTAFLTKDAKLTRNASYVLVVPLLLNFIEIASFYDEFGRDIFSEHALSVYVYIIFAVFLAEFLRRYFAGKYNEIKDTLYIAHGSAGFFVFLLVWIIPHKLIYNYDFATFVSIIIYTIAGFALYVNKHHNEKTRNNLQRAGIALFAFVIARILLVDVWELDLIYRIIVFASVGVILIATAYSFSHKKEKLRNADTEKLEA